jgi:hypothetical protein
MARTLLIQKQSLAGSEEWLPAMIVPEHEMTPSLSPWRRNLTPTRVYFLESEQY